MAIRFSEYFKLNKSQWELDFVDIPLDRNIPLYLDPSAISNEKGEWFETCNNKIILYFDLLLDSMRDGNDKTAKYLISHFHEPNDVHLGMSKKAPSGRGIGKIQARDLYKKLSESKAAKTGFLKDLSDVALLIEGINRDKISDITVNIIREELIYYTQEQCNLYNIPMENIASGKIFNFKNCKWKSEYFELPIYNNTPIVLIPKVAVRRSPETKSVDFYNRFIIDYLVQEHTKPGDELVQVLKNGKLKVLKKDVKKKYPFSADFLYEFAKDHPDILKKYKNTLRQQSVILADEEIENRQEVSNELNFDTKIKNLESIPPGNDKASFYHNMIIDILQIIFQPFLRRPKKEQEINEGRKRIDIVFDNAFLQGFFGELRQHSIKSSYIFFECKNYSKDLKNPELDQMALRFNPKTSEFGIIVCRKIENRKNILKKCKDILNTNHGYIIVLDDIDLIELLNFKKVAETEKIHDFMRDKLKQLLM